MTKQIGKLRFIKDTVRCLSESKGSSVPQLSTQVCISYSNCQSCWTE